MVGLAALGLGWLLLSLLVDWVLKDPFATVFIDFCITQLNLNANAAYNIYWQIFTANKQLFLAMGMFMILFAVFYWALSRMTSYFQEVSNGMEGLLADADEEIILSSPLSFIGVKLNRIKGALEERDRLAKEAEQRKNDLVVYLAHDIKTPLTSVIGYLNLLDEAPDMPTEQRAKYVGLTLEKAYRLEHLINEFFEITRFNLQTIVLQKQSINLLFMLQQMADEFYPQLHPQGKQAVIQVDELLTIYADADKLARVFNNILKNAVAYSYDNSAINIMAQPSGNDIDITFSNRGDTIPAEKLDTIFEKFYRLDSARSSETGGAGLGLAIAREIVHAHRGTIAVCSMEGVTTFSVRLPLKA